MSNNVIRIKGAREHNLKNIDLVIPRDQLIVFTGLSGSGKSSLAFDTIYAEGQRRYMESLSSYARQFLGVMEKPDVDSIDGLSPAISIDQKTTSKNPRSTVGTVTEIYDYLRLLYARIGNVYCPECGKEINKQTIDQIVDSIMELPEQTKIQLLAPVVRGRKGEHQKVLDSARKSGYIRVRIDGNQYELSEEITLDKNKKHTIEVVIDRLIIKKGIEKRLTDSIETVMHLSEGLLHVDVDGKELMTFSQNFSCPDCNISIDEIEPRLFSFNNPFGACQTCHGLGIKMEFDPELMIVNPDASILEGAINVPGWNAVGNQNSYANLIFKELGKKYQFDVKLPYKQLPEKVKNIILYGTNGEKITVHFENDRANGEFKSEFEGIVNSIERRYKETSSDYMRQEYEGYMSKVECPDCHGARLKREALSVKVGGININQMTALSIRETKLFFEGLELSKRQQLIGELILKEIKTRVGFLNNVGLDYLSLHRHTGSLSGGEAQRIRLATQIGSGLVGVLYILDEPSIGLHQKDNEKLIQTLLDLKKLGNTLIVVEHDEDTIRIADHIVDIGPGAGSNGGHVIAQGTLDDIMSVKESITGAYLSGKKEIPVPKQRRESNGKKLTIVNARENNLKNVTVDIPLGQFVCITGVSGSGKSSLINEILHKRLAKELNRAKLKAGLHDDLLGMEHLDKVIDIDQSPIGRTPRSNPATYTGVFDSIRDLFAQTQDAKIKGYAKGRFSFNTKGGRCEACSGDGIIKIEMNFLPDVYVPCEVCHGKRYNRETLDVHYKGKSIYDVLNMTVDEAVDFFENVTQIKKKIETLSTVGLGYIKLGQASTTLSGGEAQRIKLATELSKRSTGKTIYILDEPTTGLHFDDVYKLIKILQKLVDNGNSVVVIEHNLDVIKTADHIIDLGPDGGDRGGVILVEGTPEQVALHPISYTGAFLKKML